MGTPNGETFRPIGSITADLYGLNEKDVDLFHIPEELEQKLFPSKEENK